MKTLTTEQLETLRKHGYQGEGDLQSLIEWLGDSLHSLESPISNMSKKWHAISSETTVILGMPGRIYRPGETPLEAVYNLAVTVKS